MPTDIVLSNPLIEAAYNPPSITQLRLLFACLLQIKAGEPIGPTRAFVLDAGGLADLLGNVKGNNYAALQKAVEDMTQWTVHVDKKPNGKAGEPDRKTFSVVDSAEYFDGEGRVEIYFGHHIGPHISDLKTFFTKVNPAHLLDLETGYGARLYTIFLETLLAAGQPQLVKEYSVPEFRRMFGLEKKYRAMRDLLRRVIRPALDEINAKTDIQVKFGQRTIKRKITAFQFAIERELPAPAAALPAKQPKPLTLDEFVKKHANPGESEQRARDRLYVAWTKQSGGAG